MICLAFVSNLEFRIKYNQENGHAMTCFCKKNDQKLLIQSSVHPIISLVVHTVYTSYSLFLVFCFLHVYLPVLSPVSCQPAFPSPYQYIKPDIKIIYMRRELTGVLEASRVSLGKTLYLPITYPF